MASLSITEDAFPVDSEDSGEPQFSSSPSQNPYPKTKKRAGQYASSLPSKNLPKGLSKSSSHGHVASAYATPTINRGCRYSVRIKDLEKKYADRHPLETRNLVQKSEDLGREERGHSMDNESEGTFFFTTKDPRNTRGRRTVFQAAVTAEWAIRDIHAGNLKRQEQILNSHGDKIDTMINWFQEFFHENRSFQAVSAANTDAGSTGNSDNSIGSLLSLMQQDIAFLRKQQLTLDVFSEKWEAIFKLIKTPGILHQCPVNSTIDQQVESGQQPSLSSSGSNLEKMVSDILREQLEQKQELAVMERIMSDSNI